MKKKGLSHTTKRILAGIGCLILAVLVWLFVRYGEFSEIIIAMSNLG